MKQRQSCIVPNDSLTGIFAGTIFRQGNSGYGRFVFDMEGDSVINEKNNVNDSHSCSDDQYDICFSGRGN